MHRGYITLYRKITDHPFYKEKRTFSKNEAWIDILLEVQHSEEEKEAVIKMTLLKCHYGESLNSLQTWANRWNWSPSKVKRFFDLLEEMKQIKVTNEKVTTRIKVLNKELYDPKKSKQKKEDPTPQDIEFPDIFNFVKEFQAAVLTKYKNKAPKISNAFLLKCYKTIIQCIEIDGFKIEEIKELLLWASNDSFWSSNILALSNIRVVSKTNGLKKIQNIANGYENFKKSNVGYQNTNAAEEFVNG